MKNKQLLTSMIVALLIGCSSQERDVTTPAEPRTMEAVVQTSGATMQTSLGDGPGIAALINKNYNENTTSCTEYGTGFSRGYYFCTGVLLRTTDDGSFNPWESSPNALILGGTSYTWLRHDIGISTLWKPAGFILLSPADVLGNTVPGISYGKHGNGNPLVQCVYPFDAATQRELTRAEFGCDYEKTGLGTPNNYFSWGSCESKEHISTALQWNAHFNATGQDKARQCSWSADGNGWANMITSHNSYADNYSWNEVMLYNGGPQSTGWVAHTNEQMRLWTVAFFYDPARAGLATAQNFQRKMATTGKRVPILQLNFSLPAAQRFAFQQADQVPGLYP